MDQDGKSWRPGIARCIRQLLDRPSAPDEPNFAELAAQVDPRLCGSDDIAERDLNAVWNFADSYFDARWHGFRDMNTIPWGMATTALRDAAARLERGEVVEDTLILSYARLPRRPRWKRQERG